MYAIEQNIVRHVLGNERRRTSAKLGYWGVCDFQPLQGTVGKNEKTVFKSTNLMAQGQPTHEKNRLEENVIEKHRYIT